MSVVIQCFSLWYTFRVQTDVTDVLKSNYIFNDAAARAKGQGSSGEPAESHWKPTGQSYLSQSV